ncbi:MAG: hypothetical protein R3E10_10255 [Gemmatimonadota bacterium]
MIELHKDRLVIRAPEVHAAAEMKMEFQRTLRIPDDGRSYGLPPGLGRFPLRHVDDFGTRVPEHWIEHGGVMLPMYQSEALWINVEGRYPFAVKIAAGKTNAVTGEPWSNGLHRGPQDYISVPGQPWLDGFAVEKGVIRQFVAMPLGSGYSAEEQLTGEAEHGGLQVVAYPLKAEVWERLQRRRREPARMSYSRMSVSALREPASADMGLAPGGRMRQEIFEDTFNLSDWDQRHPSRCFVHLCNSMVWRSITGLEPPTVPPTAKEYTKAGLPWFEYYGGDAKAVEGSSILSRLLSVATMGKTKGDVPLPENESVDGMKVVELGRKGSTVREGRF